jgi:hypothetical protein
MVVLDLTRPFYKVEFYDKESSELKSVFSPNIFLETEKPSDASKVSAEIYISHITVNSKLDASVNTCEFEIRHGTGGVVPIQNEDEIKVYLGFYDQDPASGPASSLAFTGKVSKIKNGLEKSIVSGKSQLNKITTKKTKVTFARAMGINELINQFAIDTGGLQLASNGIADPGITKQPGYGITAQEPILNHIKKLAKYSALDVFMNVFDQFHAIPWDPSSLQSPSADDEPWISARDQTESANSNFYCHKIHFDKNLVDINFDISDNRFSGVEVVSLLPFSEEIVHTTEPVKVEYQPDDPEPDKPLNRFKLSLLLREDAEKVAENLYWNDAGKISGKLKLISAPQIRIGDGVQFDVEDPEQLPFGTLDFKENGTSKQLNEVKFQVTEVQHKFDTVEGFVTKLQLFHTRPGTTAATAEEEEEEEEEETVMEVTQDLEEEVEMDVGVPEEEQLVNIVVKTSAPNGDPLPNADYILLKPDGDKIEGTTGDEGTFTHEEMPVGQYQLKFKRIENPEEEKEEGGGEETG